jgi:nicotinamidase-related amidase
VAPRSGGGRPLAPPAVGTERGGLGLRPVAGAGTELDRLFRLKDVNTLVLTGVATQFAVEGTAREAVDRGYRVVVLEDCCASRIREVHRFSIDMILRSLCEVTTADRFIGDLEATRG